MPTPSLAAGNKDKGKKKWDLREERRGRDLSGRRKVTAVNQALISSFQWGYIVGGGVSEMCIFM